MNDPAAAPAAPDEPSTPAADQVVEADPDGGLGIGQGEPPPHPRPVSLVGSYVYSYDLASPSRPAVPSPTGVGRSIPSMRPSYDAEHPVSATPIYDSLYSEYRRLFRALPGDRSGEEGMRFTGFAVRDPQPPDATREGLPYPQHQTFETYAGQAHGAPQFMPAQATAPTGGQGWVASGYLGPGQPSGSGGRHRSMLSLPPGRDS
ncbi:hypothetical protein AB0K51_32305 [Kitasatospora sp. NPDC049285]|uniref:hypothetical protein n=1 Tax=Kitasatospora sp. NPDC049285 TaxID=3157096 RepID=UPI003439A8AF